MATWHGTQVEGQQLITAVGHNCGCTFGVMGIRSTRCGAHEMVADDQRALDGLLFIRHIVARLRAEEERDGRSTTGR